MKGPLWATYIGLAVATSCPFPAKADTCNPRDFTIQEVTASNLSDTMKMFASSYLSDKSSSSSSDDTSFNTEIYGAPVGLSQSDKQELSRAILEKNEFNYDRSHTESFVRTALSTTGAQMYKDCLAAQTIWPQVDGAAYTEPSFFLTVQWKPTKMQPTDGDYSILVIGGTIDGDKKSTGKLHANEAKPFIIERNPDAAARTVQITILIDGAVYPALLIPPILKPVKFEFQQVYGVAHDPRADAQHPGNECDNRAYLVSEVGSSAENGGDSKSCELCVQKPTNGVLLRSTANVFPALNTTYTHSGIKEGSDLEICGWFSTTGPGKGGGRAEVPRGSYFTVWTATAKE